MSTPQSKSKILLPDPMLLEIKGDTNIQALVLMVITVVFVIIITFVVIRVVEF